MERKPFNDQKGDITACSDWNNNHLSTFTSLLMQSMDSLVGKCRIKRRKHLKRKLVQVYKNLEINFFLNFREIMALFHCQKNFS